MDFGDILDAWDRQTARSQGNKRKHAGYSPGCGADPQDTSNNYRKPKPLGREDPLTAWLRVHGVYDKDAALDEAEETPQERHRRLLHKRVDAGIDLHGLTRDEAWHALDLFFLNSQAQGFEKLLIVHGKGNHSGSDAVLPRLVRTFIEKCPFAGESGYGSASAGGTGVTWVLLKDRRKPREPVGH